MMSSISPKALWTGCLPIKRTAFLLIRYFAAGCVCVAASAEPTMLVDFRDDAHGWVAAHAVENLRATPDGLSFDCVGEDPYIWGPLTTPLPVDTDVLLTLRMKSTADAQGVVLQFAGIERNAHGKPLDDLDPVAGRVLGGD